MANDHPYAERYGVNRRIPEQGMPARGGAGRARRRWPPRRTPVWETGKVSGTMYCGDHEHYDFMNEAFGLFAHVNALQRDICPSPTRFEGEIIAMTLDLLHAEAVTDGEPVGIVTTGGTGSILPRRARLPRARRARPGASTRPELGQARDRPPRLRQGRATCSASRCATRRSTRTTTQVDVAAMADADRRQDHRHRRLGLQLRLRHHRPDRRAVGPRPRAGRRPARRRLPRRLHPPVRPGARLRHPRRSTSACPASPRSRPTPTSTATASRARRSLAFRDKALRNSQYFFLTDWTGGKYCSPGMEGSRSGGAPRRDVGGDGDDRPGGLPRATPRRSSRPPTTMKDAVRSHPELRIMGEPDVLLQLHVATSSTSTTSTTSCGPRAGASTASSTRTPSTWRSPAPRPRPGVAEQFAADLAEAVAYANEHTRRDARERRHLRRRRRRHRPTRPTSSSAP